MAGPENLGMGDKGAPLSTIVFQQHCRRKYTLLFRAGTVLLFVMYSWRWDIHHSCSVGQTWLSSSSRVKSSRSTVPFFRFLPEDRKLKNWCTLESLGAWGWGDIGIFNNMLWKNKILPSILLEELQHYPESCTPPSCAYRNPHKNTCVPHKKFRHVHTNSVYTHIHTQPRAPIFL